MSNLLTVQAGQTNVSLLGFSLGAGDKFLVSDEELDLMAPAAFPGVVVSSPGILFSPVVALTSISADDTQYATWTPGYSGRVKNWGAIVTTAVTTAARLADLGLFIDQDGGGSLARARVSDSVLALRSATLTPAGASVAASNITPKTAATPETFGPTSVISIRTVAAPTAFAEGAVVFFVVLDPPVRV
jgi:hypothetical protein